MNAYSRTVDTGATMRRRLLIAVACVALLLPIAFNPAIFNDGDTSWHLAAGQLILELGAVPHADPFSFTLAGADWVAHEWLAEVVMAFLFHLAGWGGLAVMTALSVGATLFIVGASAMRRFAPLPVVASVIAVFLVLMPFIVARPHVLAWPLLAGWTAALLHYRRRQLAPPPWLALLMIAWANLHGSFLLGLLLAGFFLAEAVLQDSNRHRTFVGWSAFVGLCALASLATPHGLQGWLFPLQVSAMQSLPLIGEWRQTDFSSYPVFGLVLGAALVLLIARRKQLGLLRILLLLALGYMSIEHVRHQAVLAIVGSLFLIASFSPARRHSALPSRAVAAAILAMLLVAGLRLAVPVDRPDSPSNPVGAISRIPAELRDRPVLNSYAFGGPLILAGIRPYIDGRADMYGDRMMFDHRAMMDGDIAAFHRANERWRFGWTIISPLDPLASKLDRLPGWKRIYADRWAVIHVPRGNTAERAAAR